MKKILFVCYGLGIGGIEKCLVNLINVLSTREFDVDILLMNPEYDMLDQIKRPYRLLESSSLVMNTTNTINDIQNRGGVLKHPIKTFIYYIFRLRNKFGFAPWKLFKRIKKEYDIAIAYSHHDFSPQYVINKVNATRKIVWYHYGVYEASGRKYENDIKLYEQFDNVVAVSNDCAKSLRKAFPELGKKLIVLRNFCDIEDVKRKAVEFFPKTYHKDSIDIVTVGRLTPEKGADLAIKVCISLKEKGLKFCWHWVGDGNQREVISNEIIKNDISDVFVLEGNQNNPYPYIKNADIYVQPSYFEAYSTTITEAKVLYKPIVTTDVGGMRDQLNDKKNAYIVGISAEELFNAIKKLIEHEEIRESFSDNLKGKMYSFDYTLNEYKDQIFDFE